MKADQGRPYKKPKNPSKVFVMNNVVYEIFIKETVEIFQIKNDSYQRLVMDKTNYPNFEQILLNNGFTLLEQ